jgi:hypothetical protein
MSAELKLQELEARIRKLEAQVTKLLESTIEEPRLPSSGRKTRELSAREFLLGNETSSATTKVLALGYFLEQHQSHSSFNVSDLEAAFRAAKEPVPKNMNDLVNKNVAKGMLMEAKEKKDSKKSWHLTATGEKSIERGSR